MGILLRIQNFKQHGCWIASHAAPYFVNLIKHHHGIHLFGLNEPLHDAPWHRTDVGAAMSS